MPLRRTALVAGLTAVLFTTLQSASIASTPLVSSTPTTVPSFDRTVLAMAHEGSVIYVGGHFTTATDATGTYTRHGGAAYDANTGLLLPWNPDVPGTINDIAVQDDSVYLAGSFSSVRGHAVTNLARVRATGTGHLRPGLSHTFNDRIHTVAVDSGHVYVGGAFTTVDGIKRKRLASFTIAKHFPLTTWRPRAVKGGPVYSLVSVRGGVYVAGQFWKLDGYKKFGRIAELSKTTGKVIRAFNPRLTYKVLDLAVTKYRVYAAVAGPGGSLSALRRSDGRLLWKRQFDGDAQTVTVLSHRIYVGGHFTRACDIVTDTPKGYCSGTLVARPRLAAFSPSGRMTPWNPGSDSSYGVVSSTSVPRRGALVIGGQFDEVDGQPAGRLAQFDRQ